MSDDKGGNALRRLLNEEGSKESEKMYQYAERYTSISPLHIAELRDSVYKSTPSIDLLVPETEGLMLSMLVSFRNPRVVLEIGSFVGYSALWIANGLEYNTASDGPGKLYTVELDNEVAELAKRQVEKYDKQHLIEVINKSGQKVLDEWNPEKKIDIVFLDSDKDGYIHYYETLLKRDLLADNGIIVADNTLFHGRVHPIESSHNGLPLRKPANIPEFIYNFNNYIARDNRTEQILLPIFDGLTIIRKRKI